MLAGGAAPEVAPGDHDAVRRLARRFVDERNAVVRHAGHGVRAEFLVFLGNGGNEVEELGGDDVVGVDIVTDDVNLRGKFHGVPCSLEKLARIGDVTRNRRGGGGERRGEVNRRGLGAHAADEVAVRGRDDDLVAVGAAEGVDRTAEAGGAGGRCHREAAGVHENLQPGLLADGARPQRFRHFGGGWHEEGVDGDFAAVEDVRRHLEVFNLAARAGADVGAVELDVGFVRRRRIYLRFPRGATPRPQNGAASQRP